MSAIQGSFDDWSSNENISDRTLLAGLLASLMSLSVDIESFIPTVYNDSEGLVLSLEPFLENQVDVNGTTSIESAKFHSMIAEALKLWLKIAMKTMDQVCWEPENLALLFFMFCRVSLHRMDQSEYSRIDNVFGGLSACVKTASTKEVQFQQFEEFVLKFLPDVSSNVQSLYRVAEIVLMGLEDRNRLLTRGTSEVEWTIKFVAKIQLLIAGEILEIPESNSLTIDVKIDGAQRLWDKIAKISENDNQDFNRIFTSVNLLKQYME